MNKETIDKLKELQGLYAAGVISEAEFTALKKDALNNQDTTPEVKPEPVIQSAESPQTSHKVRNTIIGIFAVIGLLVAGFVVGSGAFNSQKANEPTSGVTSTEKTTDTASSASKKAQATSESSTVAKNESNKPTSQSKSSSLNEKDYEGYTLGGAYTSDGKLRYATTNPEMAAIRERLLKRWGETTQTPFDPTIRLLEARGGFSVVKNDNTVGKIMDKGNGSYKFIILEDDGEHFKEVLVATEEVR